jgi:ABC-type Fe3+-hydroxamate transport system substrate-binding protein
MIADRGTPAGPAHRPPWRRLSDDLDRPVALAAPPRRVVSLVPSLTELVCALGCADRLIGVTRYCTEPPAVVEPLAKLGGTKTPDLGRILDLRPDLVLLNAEESRREDFQVLTDAGITTFVSFPRTLVETVRSIERLGAALGADAAAGGLAAQIAAAAGERPARARRVFCPIWRKPWMSFNRDTYAHDLLGAAGGQNVCADHPQRYPVIDLQAVAQADPEVILLPDEPYPFAERHRRSLADLSETTAWRLGRIHFVDGKALSWYGPRTAPALRYFRQLL